MYKVPRTMDLCMEILSQWIVGTTFLHLHTLLSSPSLNSFLILAFLFRSHLLFHFHLPLSFGFSYSPLSFFSISTHFLPLPFISPPHLSFTFPVFPFLFPSSFSLLLFLSLHLFLPLSLFCQVFSYWHCLYHCWQASGSGKFRDASGGNWTLLCHCSCWAGCSWVYSPSPHLPVSHTPKSTQDGSCCTAGSANCIWNLIKVCGWSGAGSRNN